MRRSMAILALVAGMILVPVSHAPAALADPGCPGFFHDNVGWLWTPTSDNANGVRAPLEMRRDGLLCQNSAMDAFNAPWIGIQEEFGNQLAQIGFDHDYNASGHGHYCRFWANGLGVPHDYNCDGDSDGTFVYFKVEKFISGLNAFYDIVDCGTGGGFFTCTVENATQPAFNEAQGAVASEVDYGCTVQIMGSGTDREYIGNSGWNLNGQDSTGWGTRGWSLVSPSCSQYGGATVTDGLLRTWDTRNTS